jgi:hypothetical protein
MTFICYLYVLFADLPVVSTIAYQILYSHDHIILTYPDAEYLILRNVPLSIRLNSVGLPEKVGCREWLVQNCAQQRRQHYLQGEWSVASVTLYARGQAGANRIRTDHYGAYFYTDILTYDVGVHVFSGIYRISDYYFGFTCELTAPMLKAPPLEPDLRFRRVCVPILANRMLVISNDPAWTEIAIWKKKVP